MSIKITSPRIELQVLRAMTSRNKVIAGTLLASTNETYFASEQARIIYKAIRAYMAEVGEAPTFRNIMEDPAILKEAREHFRDSTVTITTEEEAHATLKILNKYRQLRGVYELGLTIQSKLDEGQVVVEELLDELSSQLAQVRTSQAVKESFMHFGKNNSSMDFVKDLLYNPDNDDVIPTGIPEFDEHSGGFLRGSLVSIGANSGGGKSLIGSTQLAINMAERGYKVVVVPLEMSKVEMTARLIANVGGVDSIKILQRKLATGEKDKAFEAYARWVRKVKRRGGRLTVFKPEGDVSAEDVYSALATTDADVTIIDYISLLAGTDGDDAWQSLGAIARKGKINAEATKRVNIIIAQVNEDGTVRYARSISEHSSASWIWITSQEEREKPIGRIRIKQPKARNSRSFPFEVGVEWANMRVVSVSQVTADTGDVTKPMKNLATDL